MDVKRASSRTALSTLCDAVNSACCHYYDCYLLFKDKQDIAFTSEDSRCNREMEQAEIMPVEADSRKGTELRET